MEKKVFALSMILVGIIILFLVGILNYDYVSENTYFVIPDTSRYSTVYQPHINALNTGNYVDVRILEKEKIVEKIVPVEKIVTQEKQVYNNVIEYEDWSRMQALDRANLLIKDNEKRLYS